MPSMIPFIFSQFSDSNGNPLNGGKLTFYATGTTTPMDTYADQTGNTVNQNPLTLDSAGRATIFLGSGTYDILLKDSLGNTIGTLEAISGSGSSSSMLAVDTLVKLSALTAGAADYVLLGGETAIGDGNGGFYYWDPDSTAGNSFPNVVIPDSDPDAGRWLLLWPISSSPTTGTFLMGATVFTAPQSGTARYVKNGDVVTLYIPVISGTSDGTTFQLSGIPAGIRPVRAQAFATPLLTNNAAAVAGYAYLNTNGTIDLGKSNGTSNWTSGALMEIPSAFSITYSLV